MLNQNLKIIDTVVREYITAVVFTDCGDTEQPPSDITFSDQAVFRAISECADFIGQCEQAGLLTEYAKTNYTWDSFAHDFWFTRNHHGVGFWDRGIGELGDKLTKIANNFGSSYFYEGDDGLGYFG